MRRLTLGLLTAMVLTFGAAPASAECMSPAPFLSAPDGAALPPSPTIYVFSSSRSAAIQTSAAVEQGPSERFGGVFVTRLSFRQRRGSFAVQLGERTYRYRIDPRWERGEARPTVEPARAVTDAWACSFTDVMSIRVDSRADAFEVTWAGGRAIVPRTTLDYFRRRRPAGTEGELSLGHVSCLGHTVDAATGNVARPNASHFRVTALYADGSRASVDVGPHD